MESFVKYLMGVSTKRNRFRAALKWVLWVLLFQFVLINISASLHAWKFTHFYNDPELRIVKPSSKNIFVKTWKLFAGIKFPRSLPPEAPLYSIDTVKLKTKNGLTLDAWYATPDSAAKGTVILFHGLSGNKNIYTYEAADFRYMRYNVLMVDMRGHGSSDGNVTTIGFREAEDVKLAFDFIQQKGEKKIFLWGASMGAVAIAKAISDYAIKPSGIFLDMPFASLQSHVEARSRVFGFPEEPFGFLVTGWIGIEKGFYGYGFKTTEYVKKINCPVLLSWGTRDRYVQRKEIEAVYKNIPGNHKRLVIYEEADHQSFLNFNTGKWREEVTNMLQNPDGIHP